LAGPAVDAAAAVPTDAGGGSSSSSSAAAATTITVGGARGDANTAQQGALLEEEYEESEGSVGLPDAIKLGLGDFIFYSMLVGRAAMYDMMTGGCGLGCISASLVKCCARGVGLLGGVDGYSYKPAGFGGMTLLLLPAIA
jgi:hypothetical protein